MLSVPFALVVVLDFTGCGERCAIAFQGTQTLGIGSLYERRRATDSLGHPRRVAPDVEGVLLVDFFFN